MSQDSQMSLLAADGARSPSRPLPQPSGSRFQPLRAGILNIWQYDEQEFHFHQGRLILRGENGTGKSKALEILLPFLLDANLSPRRLDPFQGSGRSMRWNLLEDGVHDQRLGYVWLELGRLVDTPIPSETTAEYITLGCGLQASKRHDDVKSWYFISRRRPGDFSLLTPGRAPLSREQLRRELEDSAGGRVFQRASEYRQQVDQNLFGLGDERYGALVHLLLQLRRPQLSEKLDPLRLSSLLGESLPPIDEDLIGRLSKTYERLDLEVREIDRLQRAAGAVEGFLEVYRDYCRGITSRRVGEMTGSESRYHRKAAEVREVEQEILQADEDLNRLATQLMTAVADLDRWRGEARALEQSEAMRAAETLQQRETEVRRLEQRATQDTDDLAAFADEAASLRSELEETEAALQRQQDALSELQHRASEAALRSGLEAVHGAAEEKLEEDATAHRQSVQGAVSAAIAQGQRAVDGLRRLTTALELAKENFQRQDDRRQRADEQVGSAAERHQLAAAAVDSERQRLTEAVEGWADGAHHFELEMSERDLLHAALDGERGALSEALQGLLLPRREISITERTRLTGELQTRLAEQQEIEEARRRLLDAEDVEPDPSPGRPSPRLHRPGAPFYRLVDFDDSLDTAQRAGLEAALQGAGLLDAWVLPDGQVLDATTQDAALVPRPLAAGRATLADLLVVETDDSSEVTKPVVEALLRSIALHDGAAPEGNAEPSDAAPIVDVRGLYALGPLRGRFLKSEPEFVGAAARRANRRRHVARLDDQLTRLERQRLELETAIQGHSDRLAGLERQARELPSSDTLDALRHRAAACADDLARRREELGQAEGAVAAARREQDSAQRDLVERGKATGLSPWIDRLDAYEDHLRTYGLAWDALLRHHLRLRSSQDALTKASQRWQLADERRQNAEQRATASQSLARRADAELATLRATVGVAAQDIVERYAAVQQSLQDGTALQEKLRESRHQRQMQHAVLKERHRFLGEDLESLQKQRQAAVADLQRLEIRGVLALLDPAAPIDAESPLAATDDDAAPESTEADDRAWTLSHALTVARQLQRQLGDLDLSDEAMNRRSRRMNQRFQELPAELGGDFLPSLDPEGDLQVLRVAHRQHSYDGHGLLTLLWRETAERQRLLAEDERQLLRGFLLGEVGDHLRGRLRQAAALVDRINELLAACRTASGMTLRLAWKPDSSQDGQIRQIIGWLRQDPDMLGDTDRQALEDFFRQRIDAARQEHSVVPWREQLLEALDYRRWHRFSILRRMPGESWNELSQRDHAASSGGEKAVALHLPLFAAAKAHYDSARPEAPHLIMLDEAFAGIDAGMRGRCMGLLVQFDLDFMMTSYDEWGCYQELPGVATYQLYRDPRLGGVEAIRFLWDGRGLEEDHVP